MDFFGIGFGELLLVLILALIIWGPRRLPEIARTLGKVARTLKKASSNLTTEITKGIEDERSHLPPKEQHVDKTGESPAEDTRQHNSKK